MEDLTSLGDVFSILVVVPVNKLQKEIFNTIKQFKKTPCIYITLNKPCMTVEKNLNAAGIEKEDIYFIDCISPKGKQKNAEFVESPSALTTISIAIEKLSSKTKGDYIIIIDSLSTFLIYNDINTLIRFISSIIQKNKGKLIMFTPKEVDRVLIEKSGQFVDKIIEL